MNKQDFITKYGLAPYDAEVLTNRQDIADYFESAVKTHNNPKALSNWILCDLCRALYKRQLWKLPHIIDWPVSAQHLAELVQLIDQGKIDGKIAKGVFEAMLDGDKSPQQIIAERVK